MSKVGLKTILEKFQKLISHQKADNGVLTYECGLKNAHTFVIYAEDKNRYITYLKKLAAKRNNQFLRGIADGLEQSIQVECLSKGA